MCDGGVLVILNTMVIKDASETDRMGCTEHTGKTLTNKLSIESIALMVLNNDFNTLIVLMTLKWSVEAIKIRTIASPMHFLWVAYDCSK